ncbi:unnamed protein product [Pieris macdunnoughi]|uniref:Uncharacterized protein n=1 Tax=Pieris macdunnoughi TaxID=345717 RepID=A0A821VPU9_9NEOP|nr:unnamed protein product [Pieris macdunnoughi]
MGFAKYPGTSLNQGMLKELLMVGGTMKRQGDAIVARGNYIADVPILIRFQDANKFKRFILTEEDLEKVATTIPNNIVPLKETEQGHQMFTETRLKP